MSEFGLDEAHVMFREKAKDFAQKVLTLGAKERAKQNRYPKEIIRQMGKEGFTGLWIPEEYGGQPGDAVMLGITAEEFAKVDYFAGLYTVVFFWNFSDT